MPTKSEMAFQLDHASRRGDLTRVNKLLREHPDLARNSTDGPPSVSPLMWAAFYGHRAVAELLLQRGCAANHVDTKGGSALHAVCSAGHLDLLELLLAWGADPRAITVHGTTSMIIAARSGHISIVAALLKVDASLLNQCDNEGFSPLIWATYMGHVKAVMYLIAIGADLNHEAVNGKTALWVARRRRHAACTQILQAAKVARDREAKRCKMLQKVRQLCDDLHGLSSLPIEHLRAVEEHQNASPAAPLVSCSSCIGPWASVSSVTKRFDKEDGVGLPVVEIGEKGSGGEHGGPMTFLEALREYVPWMDGREVRQMRGAVAEFVVRDMNADVFDELITLMGP